MIYIKKLSLLMVLAMIFSLTACDTPSFGKTVKEEYYTGGQIRSKLVQSDETGLNGLKTTYAFDGKLQSSVQIKNGVRNGAMLFYDHKGRVIKRTPYINGKIHGTEKAFYPNGDKMITFNYINGICEGYAYKYAPDGKVLQTVLYKNNRIAN